MAAKSESLPSTSTSLKTRRKTIKEENQFDGAMVRARPWLFLFSVREDDVAVFLYVEEGKIPFFHGNPAVDEIQKPFLPDAFFKTP